MDLSSSGCGVDGARRFIEPQLTGARVAQPNNDVWSIRPEKRTHSSRNLNRLIDPQSLQSLDIKNAIVKIALGTFISMNTLPLTKHLFLHDNHHISSRRTARNMNRY
jgi:hypothetical protein